MLRFSEDAKNKIIEDYNLKYEDGKRINSLSDIADSYNYSIDNVGAILAGFDSYDYYAKDLDSKLDFEHINPYKKSLIRNLSFSFGNKYQLLFFKELRFKVYADYIVSVIKEIGFGSKEFKKYLFDRIGFESITAYNTFLIKKNT